MDPLTHGLFGAAAAKLSSKKQHLLYALFAGVVGGMLPDLDILIRSEINPLLQIQYHRHFTHALLFIPFGGLIGAGFVWLFLRHKIAFKTLFLFATLGCALHGVVDATTSYGTHLLWPFSNVRTSWSTMTIIDPIVTLLLLIGVIGTAVSKNKKWLHYTLPLVALYFSFGVLQYFRAKDAMFSLAETRHHTIATYEVKPTLFNLILWRSVYQAQDDRLYIDGIRTSPLSGDITPYEGSSVPVLNVARDFPTLDPNSVQAEDIKKFTFFSAGFVAVHPHDKNVIGDMRYALLPHDIAPLWGIRINPQQSDHHVTFENYRQRTAETLEIFKRQLQAKPLTQEKNQ